MKWSVAIVLFLAGTLLWAQTQQPTAPASQQPKQKKVLTEDDLVATRPPDFVPSTAAPQKAEGDQASPAKADQGNDGEDSATTPSDEDTAAQISKLKAEQVEHQKAYDALAEKMDQATEADEKNATMDAMFREQAAIKKIQKQIDALTHPTAQGGDQSQGSEGAKAAPEQPKSGEQPH